MRHWIHTHITLAVAVILGITDAGAVFASDSQSGASNTTKPGRQEFANFYDQAGILSYRRDYKEAIPLLLKAIPLAPTERDASDAKRDLGYAYEALGQYSDAEPLLKEVAIDRGDFYSRGAYIRTLIGLKKYADAEAVLKTDVAGVKAQTNVGDGVRGYGIGKNMWLLGTVQFKQSKYAESEATLSEAIKIIEPMKPIVNHSGPCVYNESAPIDPSDKSEMLSLLHAGLAQNYATQGKNKEAETEYAQALHLCNKTTSDPANWLNPSAKRELLTNYIALEKQLGNGGKAKDLENQLQKLPALKQASAP